MDSLGIRFVFKLSQLFFTKTRHWRSPIKIFRKNLADASLLYCVALLQAARQASGVDFVVD